MNEKYLSYTYNTHIQMPAQIPSTLIVINVTDILSHVFDGVRDELFPVMWKFIRHTYIDYIIHIVIIYALLLVFRLFLLYASR